MQYHSTTLESVSRRRSRPAHAGTQQLRGCKSMRGAFCRALGLSGIAGELVSRATSDREVP
eukprot:62888-Prymnesium_polylepis.1